MIYVTVGTMNYTFTRLMEGLERLPNDLKKEIVAQIGVNDPPKEIKCFRYCPRSEAMRHIDEAELIITHGGSTLMEALLKGKRMVAVPRTVKYQEALNDHQVHLCQKLAEKDMITFVLDMADLQKAIERALGRDRTPAIGGPLPGRFLKLLKNIETEIK